MPIAVILAAVVLLALAVGNPAHAVPPDEAESDDTGMYLLREAALAGRTQAYSGVQVVTVQGRDSAYTAMVDVSNVPGAGLTMHPEVPGAGTAHRVDPGSPAGGLSAPREGMLDVLSRNYRVVAAGEDFVCGRPSLVVRALRPDGTVAAAFWVDRASRVVLRREIFDGRGRLAQTGVFVNVELPEPARVPQVRAARRGALLDTAALAGLRARGWAFPMALPGRLRLFTATEESGGYLHLGYSDGLSVVSVFVQPGHLAEDRLRGWHAESLNGHTIWIRESAGQETLWTSGDHVYTVVADAPADLVDAAVAALPHDDGLGLWGRMWRGADRLLSWINPFG